jgi:hypothetical protein
MTQSWKIPGQELAEPFDKAQGDRDAKSAKWNSECLSQSMP